jgi:Na+/H+-dicarboxylate symporter
VSALTPVERNERRRLQRRREVIRWSIRALVVILIFSLGIALGQAIQDNPQPGRTVTFDQTLEVPTTGERGSTITP